MPITDNMVMYLAMEQAVAAVQVDSTGNGNSGTPTGTGTMVSVAGKVGNALQFPSNGDVGGQKYLTVANSATLQLGNLDCTLWGWYRQDNLLSGGLLINKSLQWLFEVFRSGADFFEFYDVYYGGVGAFTRLSFNAVYAGAVWTFWMVEYTASTRTARLYRNNVLTTSAVLPAVSVHSASDLLIGETLSGTVGATMTHDEQGIASRIFTSDERDCLYNGGSPGAYPGFCFGNAGWLTSAMRVRNKDDFSSQAYGTESAIVIVPTAANRQYIASVNLADTDGLGKNDQGVLKVRRYGGDPNDAGTKRQTLVNVRARIPVI